MSVFYNENDPKAAATLRELIKVGLIASGEVDERSIEDIRPSELAKYDQCHFFAGFGIWSYALRLAEWPDDRPVWTGSCPCQPFSQAGKGAGTADERHLWPAFNHLIQYGKRTDIPVYGEQVASPDALAWLDLVQADLEAEGYTVRAFDLCAAGFGAPIIRQRLFWMASTQHSERRTERNKFTGPLEWAGSGGSCEPNGMGESKLPSEKRQRSYSGEGLRIEDTTGPSGRRLASGLEPEIDNSRMFQEYGASSMASSIIDGLQRRSEQTLLGARGRKEGNEIRCRNRSLDESERPRATNGFWRDADWLRCRDEQWRPVEPGTFPLAHGYPKRMGILRGAGNAINAEVARYFIEVTM